jgi:superkiller protein 3
MLNRGGVVVLAVICCVMAVGCVYDGTMTPVGMPSEEFLEHMNASLKDCDASVQSDPDNAEAWFIRGMYYNNNYNQYDEALVSCEKALELDPKYGAAWFLKGIILTNMNRHCESLPCFENATRYDPELAVDAHDWYVYNEKKCSQ